MGNDAHVISGGGSIALNVRRVLDGIAEAATRAGRDPDGVTLLAVSKTRPVHEIAEIVGTGILNVGENRVQEAASKIPEMTADPVTWHMIGRLQSNKAKTAVHLFDWIDSVHSIKLVDIIAGEAEKLRKTVNILVQVNISGEASKSGIDTGEETRSLIAHAATKEWLSVRGLMTIGSFGASPDATRSEFARMRELYERLREDPVAGPCMNVLSMGMSGDYTIAVEEGATMVRVGSALFGART